MTSRLSNAPTTPRAAPGEAPGAADTPSAPSSPGAFAAPLLIWALLQIVPLALAALRVPLSANYPVAGERLAIELLLAMQIGSSAILFPWILRDRASALATMACVWPPIVAAALLSAVPLAQAFYIALFVTLWLAGLALWRLALPWPQARFVVVAALTLWTVGGPLLTYLHAEFAASASAAESPATLPLLMSGPIAMAWQLTASEGMQIGIWMPITIQLATGGLICAMWELRNRNHP